MPSLYGAVKSKTGEVLQESMDYCKGALQSVSRSFALTIPLVEENILAPIMVGYLEARILDTFEDDIGRREISLEERIHSMNLLMEVLESPSSSSAKEKAKEWANDILQKRKIVDKLSINEPISWNEKVGHTAHLTSADRDGNVVSLTQTIGPLMGSKVASKNLGFLYAVTLGGYLGDYKPGDRANSHISPIISTQLFPESIDQEIPVPIGLYFSFS